MSGKEAGRARRDRSSPDSDSNKSGSVSGPRRRPSRVGSRSVNTLSAAQLERKRQNDREAQRAIRQRQRDRIEGLEKKIAELTENPGSSQQLVAALQRSKELEEENSYLRQKLEQAGIPVSTPERSGSWDSVISSRPSPLHAPVPGVQPEHPELLRRRSSQDQSHQFTYRPVHQWSAPGLYQSEPHIKPEGTPSPGGHINPHDYPGWSVDRSRVAAAPGGREDLPPPVDYAQMVGNQPYAVPGASTHGQSAMLQPQQHPVLSSYRTIHPYASPGQTHQQSPQSQQDISRTPVSQSQHGSQQMFYGSYPPPP